MGGARLAACWGETTIVWNNQPGVAASATTTTNVCGTAGCNTYYSFVVTTDVQSFVAGTANNYGWRIKDSAEDSATSYSTTFSPKNAGTAQAPELVIVYTP